MKREAILLLVTGGVLVYSCAGTPTPGPGTPGAVPGFRLLTPESAGLFEWPSWSPDAKRLAFSRSESTALGEYPLTAELFILDLELGEATQLTDNDLVDAHPDWSPDGSSIVFARSHSEFEGPYQLMTISPDGTAEKELLNCQRQCEWPAWSPDGQVIAFVMDGLMLIRADGSDLRRLGLKEFTIVNTPTWSPDGTRLAYLGAKELTQGGGPQRPPRYLAVVDLLSGDETIILEGIVDRPDWSPDGIEILFGAPSDRASATTTWTLYAVDPAEGNAHRLIADDFVADLFHATWSPDGSAIAFAFGSPLNRSVLYLLEIREFGKVP